MTAHELLLTCSQAGIVLAVDGDCLDVEGPEDALTPAMVHQLSFHKPALLALLAPVTEFIPLTGGLVVPAPALLLALDLERRKIEMRLDSCQQFQIDESPELTEADRLGIDRWRRHLGAVVGYDGGAQ